MTSSLGESPHQPPSGSGVSTKTSGHVLVCVGPTCSGRGSPAMFDAVWSTLDRESIAYYRSGGSVRLTRTDCLGACDLGPTVASYRRTGGHHVEEFYVAMTAQSTVELARSIHEAFDANDRRTP